MEQRVMSKLFTSANGVPVDEQFNEWSCARGKRLSIIGTHYQVAPDMFTLLIIYLDEVSTTVTDDNKTQEEEANE